MHYVGKGHHNRVTRISTVKFKINNIAFTIKDSLRSLQLKHERNRIIGLYNRYMCISLITSWTKCLLLKDHVAYNQAQFKHPAIFFGEISHLQCDVYPVILTGTSNLKLFGRCIYLIAFFVIDKCCKPVHTSIIAVNMSFIHTYAWVMWNTEGSAWWALQLHWWPLAMLQWI